MKNHLIRTLLVVVVLSACGPSKKVSFNVTQPAEITLPQDINTILLVDRTKFDNETLNTIEGILTGELPADDKAAAQEAMTSLKNELDRSPRFRVKIHPVRLKGNSITAAFPDALPWNVVDELCVANNTEAVVALEVYDSNFIITNGTRVAKRTEGTGANARQVDYTEYWAQGVGSLKMGIRSYNSKNNTIIDQQMLHKTNTWEATGTTALDAAAALISKSKANKYLAKGVGSDYAYKISPMPIRISRQFYGKAKHVPEVASGTRYADVNKWDEAINTWKSAISKADNDDAGKLSYNIAVAYEVLGEYGTALTWAQDAYTKYGNKEARGYVNTLRYRIDEEKILQEQMNGSK